jgi:hypothetical protein
MTAQDYYHLAIRLKDTAVLLGNCEQIDHLVVQLADEYAEVDPNFDRDKFLKDSES